jgi:hypothetical protein
MARPGLPCASGVCRAAPAVAAAFAPSLVWLGVALFALGMFAAIYHRSVPP